MNSLFTWIPIHSETTAKLLTFAEDRTRLIHVLSGMAEAGLMVGNLTDQPQKGVQEEMLSDVDPFTFLAVFNRTITDDNRRSLWSWLKSAWELKSELPKDFNGIPRISALNFRFMPWRHDQKDGDCECLWDFAKRACEHPDAVSNSLFQNALRVKTVGLAKLTMGLYWMKPETYLSLDKKNCASLQTLGLNPSVNTWDEYKALLSEFKKRSKQSIPEFTYAADSSIIAPLMAKFKRIMPDFVDFQYPGEKLKENELNYKRKLLSDFQLKQADIESALDRGDALSAIEELKSLIVPSHLINWRTWDLAFGNPIQENSALAILNSIRQVSHQPYTSPDSLAPVFDAMKTHDSKIGWGLLTMLLWLWNPQEYYLIRSTAIRNFASQLGHKLKKVSPDPIHFDEFMQLGKEVRQLLAPWKPHDDWVDVQSFIWVTTVWEDTSEKTTADSHIWVVAPGENAYLWDEFYEDGIIAIGWDELGDLSEYSNRDDIQKALTYEQPDKNPRNNSLACWQFVHAMRNGDWVLIKNGMREVLGIGIVTSDYQFDTDRDTYKHVRTVNWLKRGNWDVSPITFPMKTLTDYTSDTTRVRQVLKQMSVTPLPPFISDGAITDDPGLAPPFDRCFSSREEAECLLDLGATALMSLGLDMESGDDPRIAITLPETIAGSNGALRVNFGKAVAFSYLLGTKEGATFQFSCRRDLLPANVADQRVDTTFSPWGEDTYLLVRMPVEWTADDHAQEIICASMDGLKKHFSAWKGTPYRQYHNPKLFDLFFDEVRRAELLGKGLRDPIVMDPDTELNEPYQPADALQELFISEAVYQRMATLLRRKKNLILQGPPGVGKSFLAKRLAYSLMGEKDKRRVTMIQFHQSYAYEDFIQGYRPSGGDGASFEKKDGVFYRFCKRAQANLDQDYYFIIDEINRGNLSRIFGELMLLIEHDKRGSDYELPLTYTPDEHFHVPQNVHIIGMMNTADRSLAMVDYALRRRFAFMTLEPEFGSNKFNQHLSAMQVSEAVIGRICERMTSLNKLIANESRDLGRGFCIGHSFFCPTSVVEDSEMWYQEVIESEIQPLLEEYWADGAQDKVEQEIEKLRHG